MKELLIKALQKSGPLTIPEICDAITQDGKTVRTMLSSLLAEKVIRVFVEPNEFGCTGCGCGSCDIIPPKYALL